MIKTILPFYIICFALYIFFSRRPDYQDGEFTTGTIHYLKDSTRETQAKAIFTVDKISYTINTAYPLRSLKEGKAVTIIYETTDPAKAAVYSWWGYWLQWDELLASVLIPLVLLYAAKEITGRPTPEALVEELEMDKKSRGESSDKLS